MLGTWVLEGEKTWAVRKGVVGNSRLRVTTLVEELEVARVDGHGLVWVGADEVTVGDVVGPGGTAVCLAGEWVCLSGGLGGPGAAQAGGGEGAEEAAVDTLGLDDHEVLVLARKGVDLHGLEELGGRRAHDDGRGGAEAAGEVANWHAGTVDGTVVSGEEEVHVLAVTNDGLVNWASARVGDGAREKWLGGRPSVDVAWVAVGPVREGGWTPLVGKDPGALWSKVEEGWSNGGGAHTGLGCRAHLRPVREEAESHRAVGGSSVVGAVDKVLAVVDGVGKVLESGPAVLWLCESGSGRPLEARWESTGGCVGSGCKSHHQGGIGHRELHDSECV